VIEFVRFKTPIGFLSILAIKDGVLKISFSNESLEKILQWSRKKIGIDIVKGNEFTYHAKGQILDYLSRKRKSLVFSIVHFNSPFRMRVLEAERKIPYGETRSYGQIANLVGSTNAYRAVGSANAANPLPLYFPCHRIIHSDGRIGRFGGGEKIKKFLLELEK